VQLTYSTALVLHALAQGYHYGFDIMDVTGLPSGTVYPILRRFDREGLVRARWEKAEIAQREQRPPRRYYELTPAGEAVLEAAVRRYRALEGIPARSARKLRPARP
jgi:DNA-binding PadR family transcriptional regulator